MNKKIIYIIAGVAGFLILVVFLMAISSKNPNGTVLPGGPVTLTFWKPFESTENMQPFIEAYTTLHPNVQIQYTKKNVDTYERDLVDALASGNGPDIFSINNGWLPKYMDKATSAPASTISLKDYKDAFVDVAVNDFVKDGKVYAVPLSVDSLALYYNKDLLGTVGIATPPKTWQELALDSQKLSRNSRGFFSRSGVTIGTNTNVNRAVDILYLFMLQKGVKPFNQDSLTPSFAEPVYVNNNSVNPGQEALDFYTSFANPGNPNYSWNYNSNYSIDAFTNGQAAFMYSYYYTRETILQKSPNLNFDIASVPQPNLDNPSVNFSNYWGETVSKQSKNAAYAWDFLKFMSSKEQLDKYYVRHQQPSSRKDLISLQIQNADVGVFANANLTSKSFYRPDQAQMDTIFGNLIDNVIRNGVSVSDALNQAEQQAAVLSRQ
jgi:multiple sugar transport system substrate-binding protein